ncbi:unnamed protein product, partial [Prorocentrum cordatum]
SDIFAQSSSGARLFFCPRAAHRRPRTPGEREARVCARALACRRSRTARARALPAPALGRPPRRAQARHIPDLAPPFWGSTQRPLGHDVRLGPVHGPCPAHGPQRGQPARGPASRHAGAPPAVVGHVLPRPGGGGRCPLAVAAAAPAARGAAPGGGSGRRPRQQPSAGAPGLRARRGRVGRALRAGGRCAVSRRAAVPLAGGPRGRPPPRAAPGPGPPRG